MRLTSAYIIFMFKSTFPKEGKPYRTNPTPLENKNKIHEISIGYGKIKSNKN